MPQKKNDMRTTMKAVKAAAAEAKRSATTTKSPSVQKALRKDYPQMYNKAGKLKPRYRSGKTTWVSELKKKVKRVLGTRPKTRTRTKQVEKAIGNSLTKKELDKMR